MTTTNLAGESVLAALSRQEIRNYLRSKLFWLGVAAMAAYFVTYATGGIKADGSSTAGDGLLPAAVIGLLGISIMAGMTRRSDQAAAAAGAVGVSQRTRTLALASATVVPATVGLLWFVAAVIAYYQVPPSPRTIPVPGTNDAFWIAGMFAEGVMSCIGGPLLGLVIGRWLPIRAAAPLISVLIVPVTMVLQPLFDFARAWHWVWIWTHAGGPFGVPGDENRFLASSGSPYFYVAYLAALCVLGVLVALYRDPEGDRARLRQVILLWVGVSVVLCVLAIVVGPDHWLVNPLESPELYRQ